MPNYSISKLKAFLFEKSVEENIEREDFSVIDKASGLPTDMAIVSDLVAKLVDYWLKPLQILIQGEPFIALVLLPYVIGRGRNYQAA